jgi:hypothetical protein
MHEIAICPSRFGHSFREVLRERVGKVGIWLVRVGKLARISESGFRILFPPLIRGEMSAFSGGGALHQQDQKGEDQSNYRENQEGVEIGKSRGLLFAKILQRL